MSLSVSGLSGLSVGRMEGSLPGLEAIRWRLVAVAAHEGGRYAEPGGRTSG